ncbi:MAG: hypothetical protein ABEI32_10200 [Halothece sp.]
MVISNLNYLEVMSDNQSIEGGYYYGYGYWKEYDNQNLVQTQIATNVATNVAIGDGATAFSFQSIDQDQFGLQAS